VRRNVDAGPPVVVEYELTEYADALEPILQALSQWGSMHREKIRRSMRRKKSVAG
ncbi:MAG TPA: winged helix-turn-helix transcriptional regulator, partial [Flavitalea sp.]|nr:winged helix-turn-helix transcriptional regulator [Flavitalea sp.]